MLVGTRHQASSWAASARRSDHHDLGRFAARQVNRAKITSRSGLKSWHRSKPNTVSPRQAREFSHLDKQGRLAIRECGDNRVPLQACEVFDGIGHPHGRCQTRFRCSCSSSVSPVISNSLNTSSRIMLHPRPGALAHMLDRRTVSGAPAVGESAPEFASPGQSSPCRSSWERCRILAESRFSAPRGASSRTARTVRTLKKHTIFSPG